MKKISRSAGALISIVVLSAGVLWLHLVSPPPLISHPSALRAGDLEAVQRLVMNGLDINHPNSKGVTPLHVVAQEGHVALAQLLLQNGANPHARYDNLWTPLHLAAQNGHLEMVTLLINYGARVIGLKDDFTPLHFASQEGYIDIAQLLLSHGADVRARYQNGWTPLHLAAQEGHVAVIELLLKHGASTSAQNAQGFTPLHSAAFLGRLGAVRSLLTHGADPEAKDHEGQTPGHLAVAGGFQDITRLLSKFVETGKIPEEFSVESESPKGSNKPNSPERPSDIMPAVEAIPGEGSWNQASTYGDMTGMGRSPTQV